MHDARHASGTSVQTSKPGRRKPSAGVEPEDIQRLLKQVEDLADVTLSRLAPAQLLVALSERARQALRLNFVTVLVMSHDEQALTVHTAGDEDGESRAFQVPLGVGVTAYIMAHREPLVIEDLAATTPLSPFMPGRARSLAAIPLEVEGRLLGVLYAGTYDRRTFAESDVWLLRLMGDRLASAIERLQLRQDAVAAREQSAMHASELRASLDALPDPMLVFDRHKRVIQTNAAATAFFGFDLRTSPMSATVAKYGRLLRADGTRHHGLKQLQTIADQLLRGDTIDWMNPPTVVVRTLSDRRIRMELGGAPVYTPDRDIAGGVLLFREITEHHPLDVELAKRASEIAIVVDAMMDGVVICDRDGQVVHSNRAFRELFGIQRESEITATGPGQRERLLHIRDAQGRRLPARQSPERILLQGATLQGSSAMDLRMRTVDGRELTISVTGAPLREAQGRIAGVVAIYRDVTLRRQLEQHTEQALHALQVMAEILTTASTPAGGAPDESASRRVNTIHRFAELTRQVLGGRHVLLAAVEAPDLALRPLASHGRMREHDSRWHKPVGPRRLDDYLSADVITQLRSGQVVTQMIERSGDEGSPAASRGGRSDPPQRPSSTAGRGVHERSRQFGESAGRMVLVAPMRLGDELVGVLGIDFGPDSRPIGEAERALAGAVAHVATMVMQRDRIAQEREESHAREVAVRDLTERLDEFLAVASHDLRQPVTGCIGYLQLATRHFDDVMSSKLASTPTMRAKLGKVEQDLAHANQSIDRLYRLVNRLFDVARIRSHQFDVRVEPMDLSAIVRTIVAEERMAQSTHPIQSRLPSGRRVTVLADADRIGQVLTNYLSNAIRYSPPGSPVVVRMSIRSDHVRVSVRDHGRGIAPDELDHIWARFERPAGSRSHAEGGLGLGLYISKQIVELHGGKVGVESTPGKGSTFWLALSRADSMLSAT
jgi:PAS domain S-box-containing protein